MEKLIELLNEYETKTVVHWYEWYGENVLMCRYIKDNFEFYTDEAAAIAISKYYGFIKWLVENNKIDIDEINNNHLDIEIFYKQTYGPNYGEGGYGEVGYWYKCIGLYESLLCNLAISDTPIDDLISYLK